jgi:hypothetical protein
LGGRVVCVRVEFRAPGVRVGISGSGARRDADAHGGEGGARYARRDADAHGASVWYNGYLFNVEHVYVNGLTPVRPDEPERKRETIVVATWGDPRSVADALPALLPLLGIPVDAVGLVERRSGQPSS